jgi:hypothetical protein
MSPSRAVATAVLLLATPLVLGACDEDGDTPAAERSSEVDPSSGTSPSVESTAPTESAEATESTEVADPEAIATAYPDVGLRLVDFPELTTKNRAVLDVFVRFQRGRQQLLRDQAMNDLVLDTSAQPVVAQWQDVADTLKKNKTYFRGQVVLTFTDVPIKRRVVVVDVCLDGSGLRLVENGQPGSLTGPPRAPFRTVLTRLDSGWAVTESRTLPGTC